MENKRTWIYCRVAHPDAHALAMQQSSLEAYAEANGCWLEDRFVAVVCADGTVPQTATEILHGLMKASGISLDRVH